MDFLNEYHLYGLALGVSSFLIIGLFHPVVIKAEYYWGTRCWWLFLLLGIAGAVASLCAENTFISALLASSPSHLSGASKKYSSKKNGSGKAGSPRTPNGPTNSEGNAA